MQELKKFSKQELISETQTAIIDERKATTRILRCFREIESRMIYAEMGFSSLYEMATKYFRLSEGAAHRRISAMRLIRDVSEIAPALEEGKLSLSVASTMQDFFRAEKRAGKRYEPQEKLELVKKMEGKSKRDCEKELRAISPHSVPQESERVLSPEATEVRFVMNPSLAAKLARLKGLLAHRTKGDSTYAKLFEVMAEIVIEEVDPQGKLVDSESPTPPPPENPTAPERVRGVTRKSRYVPAQVNRQLWKRAGGQCE
ncbi:hypothetical protein WDW86_22150 [Bdellovibrionota bacterium FG-2]